MKIKILLLIPLGIFMMPKGFGQFFSRVYFNENNDVLRGRNFSIIPLDSTSFAINNGVNYIDNSREIHRLCTYSAEGDILVDRRLNDERWAFITGEALKERNDSLFLLSQSSDENEWFLEVYNKGGALILENSFDIPLVREDDSKPVGIEFVSRGEMILWGYGYNPNDNGDVIRRKVMWLRLDRNFDLISGPNYDYVKSEFFQNYIVDSGVDIDGNFVYVHEKTFQGDATYNIVSKIDSNDSISVLAKIKLLTGSRGFPQFAITRDGEIITASDIRALGPSGMFQMIKMGRDGKEEWRVEIPELFGPVFGPGSNYPNLNQVEVNRIRMAKNGDILFAGNNAFIDSFYFPKYKRNFQVSDLNASFFGRMSPDGTLKWLHNMVSLKNTSDGRLIFIFDINEAANGDLLLAGSRGRTDTLDFKSDAWVMRVGENGCFDRMCSHVKRYWYFPDEFPYYSTDISETIVHPLNIRPNPTNSYIEVDFPFNTDVPFHYEIKNMLGQQIEIGIENDGAFRLDVNHLLSGVYILAIKDGQGKRYQSRFVKE